MKIVFGFGLFWLKELVQLFAVFCTHNRWERVLPKTSDSAFKNPKAPPPRPVWDRPTIPGSSNRAEAPSKTVRFLDRRPSWAEAPFSRPLSHRSRPELNGLLRLSGH
jgi:hypothetical protein